MPIAQSTLSDYAVRASVRKSGEIVEEARASKKQTAFLSHSHSDARLAKGVQVFLQAHGWDVYIDWEDTTMPPTPSKETAQRIQLRIRQLDWFLFLATANSMASRWCPWEIGYADGVKEHDSILILPTRDNTGNTHGSEYLQLYRFIDNAEGGGVGAFGSDKRGMLVEQLAR